MWTGTTSPLHSPQEGLQGLHSLQTDDFPEFDPLRATRSDLIEGGLYPIAENVSGGCFQVVGQNRRHDESEADTAHVLLRAFDARFPELLLAAQRFLHAVVM